MGVTSWVDAAGRVRARYDIPAAGTMMTEPALVPGGATIYARAGDAPWVILVGVGLAVHLNGRRKRRDKNAKGAEASATTP